MNVMNKKQSRQQSRQQTSTREDYMKFIIRFNGMILVVVIFCLALYACESARIVQVITTDNSSDMDGLDRRIVDAGKNLPDKSVTSLDATLIPPTTCDEQGPRKVYAVYHMNFSKVMDGVTAGFNLDESVSRIGDGTGCGHNDYLGLYGELGIDNQFQSIIPLLNPILGQTLDESLTRTIQEKAFIILIEILGLDDMTNDECVQVNLFRATTQALVGTDGLLLEGQSFDIDLDLPWAHAPHAYIDNARLYTGPFELALPIKFSEISLRLFLSTAFLELDILNEPSTQEKLGILGGILPVSSLVESVANIEESLAPLAQQLIAGKADLEPDDSGTCQSISIAWQIKAHTAHLYTDTQRPDDSSY